MMFLFGRGNSQKGERPLAQALSKGLLRYNFVTLCPYFLQTEETDFTTIPVRANRAIALGITIR